MGCAQTQRYGDRGRGGEGKKKSTTKVQRNDWWHRRVKREQKQDPGQINCNDSNHCISTCYFFFSLIRKKESRQVKYLNPAHILQIFVLRVVQTGHQDTLSRDGESLKELLEKA